MNERLSDRVCLCVYVCVCVFMCVCVCERLSCQTELRWKLACCYVHMTHCLSVRFSVYVPLSVRGL
jgi:hypothetical protein